MVGLGVKIYRHHVISISRNTSNPPAPKVLIFLLCMHELQAIMASAIASSSFGGEPFIALESCVFFIVFPRFLKKAQKSAKSPKLGSTWPNKLNMGPT